MKWVYQSPEEVTFTLYIYPWATHNHNLSLAILPVSTKKFFLWPNIFSQSVFPIQNPAFFLAIPKETL
jgi:hypothetical protein